MRTNLNLVSLFDVVDDKSANMTRLRLMKVSPRPVQGLSIYPLAPPLVGGVPSIYPVAPPLVGGVPSFCATHKGRRYIWQRRVRLNRRPLRAGLCLFVVAVLISGCQRPHREPQPVVREGRLEELMASMANYEPQSAKQPQGSQELTELNADLRARYEQELSETLERIEQSYLSDQDDWMQYEPLRSEEVRSIWNTNPKNAP